MSTEESDVGDLVPGSWDHVSDTELEELIQRFRNAIANRLQFLPIYLSDPASEWTTEEGE